MVTRSIGCWPKTPNASAEMLDSLSRSLDDKTVQSVTEHPNTPVELLDGLGGLYPLSLFRNPVLPALLKMNKDYLGKFHGKAFESALKQKNVPALVVDWLVKHGKAEQQAAFLFGARRAPELTARFRQCKHSAIVARLVQQDDETYLAWATDLGFEQPVEDTDGEQGELRSLLDDWVEQLWSQNQTLWTKLVPASGPADSLQGELVRALGRIETEYFKNGMMNWGDGYLEDLTALLHSTLKDEKSFSPLVMKILDADIAQIKKSGSIGKALASGKKPRSAALNGNVLLEGDTEKSHQRLGALITLWCQRHPEPIPYPAVQ